MSKLILTAGPSITKKEISYVTNAVKNGWNNNAYSFTSKFERKFSEYTGAKYAIATSGGTWALHLSFLAIGLKKGDEVIVPDLCYFSPLDVLVSMGVRLVFADILENTWCIDPEDIKKKITKKTKAIMPVYMYGNLTEAYKIREIAQKYGLKVIDDSCPAVGSFYDNKHAGYFADMAAFSFQGAKILTTGLGGMLVTNSKKLFERALFLNHQGQKGPKFWPLTSRFEARCRALATSSYMRRSSASASSTAAHASKYSLRAISSSVLR
jgi:perosamine synthetase